MLALIKLSPRRKRISCRSSRAIRSTPPSRKHSRPLRRLSISTTIKHQLGPLTIRRGESALIKWRPISCPLSLVPASRSLPRIRDQSVRSSLNKNSPKEKKRLIFKSPASLRKRTSARATKQSSQPDPNLKSPKKPNVSSKTK